MSHAHGPVGPSPRRIQIVVAAILVPLAVLTGIGLAVLWPYTGPATIATDQPARRDATVTAVQPEPCQQRTARQCGSVTVRLTNGPQSGQTVTATIPEGPGSPVVSVGDDIVVAESVAPEGPPQYAVLDHQRGVPLAVLIGIFALVIVAFGRWQGVAALIGLGVSFAILLTFILPAIAVGKPPLLIAIVGASAIMFMVLYLTHGFSVQTSVAVLGTLVSLTLTGGLAVAATEALHLTGFGSEDTGLLAVFLGEIDPRGLLLAGIVIGTLGVLDDVTVTQAATVGELAQANPTLDARGLYRAATRVGRSHIASTVNTIVLAYAGASLPLLLLVIIGGQPASTVLTSEFIVDEIVRSVVGTIGLVAAVPVTTGLAALVTASRYAVGHR
ncbi:YibE/F family protein [Asanoa sp. WMMD1127]|uniref:YibE/F family protein n=1 Tax=Asanoa sp. WMMD1127 TaxID=3016107 RepID=UPI00241680A9|nr:YibE/F family protein [Asanoa sp. WMMD1127]MDG4820874.1 YibE/F family protein [Asanoa sp. WMMD1127]